MSLADVPGAQRAAGFLVGARQVDQRAPRPPPTLGQRLERDRLRGGEIQHVDCPAPPHLAVDELPPERIARPVRRRHGHDVGVAHETQSRRGGVGALDAGDETDAAGRAVGFVDVDVEAAALEVGPQQIAVALLLARGDGAVVHALVADQLLQELDGLRGQRIVHDDGVWRVRNSVTVRIDSARCVGPRQSFWIWRFGASRAISALVSAGWGLSVPGCRSSGVRHRRTNSRLTEKTKSPPNMLWPNFLMTASVPGGSRPIMVLAKPRTAASQVSRFSCRPIGFWSTAAATRSGASSHRVRQKVPPMQPPIT